jgi:hypothetical protein
MMIKDLKKWGQGAGKKEEFPITIFLQKRDAKNNKIFTYFADFPLSLGILKSNPE